MRAVLVYQAVVLLLWYKHWFGSPVIKFNLSGLVNPSDSDCVFSAPYF